MLGFLPRLEGIDNGGMFHLGHLPPNGPATLLGDRFLSCKRTYSAMRRLTSAFFSRYLGPFYESYQRGRLAFCCKISR